MLLVLLIKHPDDAGFHHGKAGIGKTALAQQFLHRPGFAVVIAHGHLSLNAPARAGPGKQDAAFTAVGRLVAQGIRHQGILGTVAKQLRSVLHLSPGLPAIPGPRNTAAIACAPMARNHHHAAVIRFRNGRLIHHALHIGSRLTQLPALAAVIAVNAGNHPLADRPFIHRNYQAALVGAALQLGSRIRAGRHNIHSGRTLGRLRNLLRLRPGRTSVPALNHEIADALFIIPSVRDIGLPLLDPGRVTLEHDSHGPGFGVINRARIIKCGAMGLGNRPGTGPGLPAILADAHDNIVLPLVGILVPSFGECQKLALADTEQGGNADGGIGIALPGAEYGHSPVRREIAFLFLPERRQCHGAYGTHQTLEYGIHHLFHPIPFSPSAQ